MTTTILTGEVNVHPVFAIFGDDTARARRYDPITSHMAADRSSTALSETQIHVLDLFIEHGAMTDSELNDAYQVKAERLGWKQVRPDTPRKRRSDLSGKGLLKNSGMTRPNAFGSLEVVWEVA